MSFTKASTGDRRDMVLDQLLSFIAANKDAAGTRLPPEGELAEMFGVSRTVIRESMRSLQATGVVRIEQGRGTFVSEHPFSQPFNVWATLNAHRVNELFEVRIILEGESAARAAGLAGKGDLAALADAMDTLRGQATERDWDGVMSSDRAFHRTVTRMAGLPMLTEMLEVTIPSWMNVTAKFGSESNQVSRIRSVVAEHQAILDAISIGDAVAARAAMHQHLRNSLQRRLKEDNSAGGKDKGRGKPPDKKVEH